MSVAALPYFRLPAIGGINVYGPLFGIALVLGGVAMVLAARRRGISDNDSIGLAALTAGAGFLGSHLFDVIVNQRDEAAHDPSLWFAVLKGISLFGGLLVAAVVVVAWTHARKLSLAKVADSVVLGGLVALVIGRIACALVHDHPGAPTSLPIGFDFPVGDMPWLGIDNSEPVMRLHDLGFDELLLVLPLAAGMWLVARRLRDGMVASIAALLYAGVRFGLDFLRLPMYDLRYAGLTAAQWGCIAMAAIAIAGLLWPKPGARSPKPATTARPPTLDPPNTRP